MVADKDSWDTCTVHGHLFFTDSTKMPIRAYMIMRCILQKYAFCQSVAQTEGFVNSETNSPKRVDYVKNIVHDKQKHGRPLAEWTDCFQSGPALKGARRHP